MSQSCFFVCKHVVLEVDKKLSLGFKFKVWFCCYEATHFHTSRLFFTSGWTLSTICLNTCWVETNRTLWRAAASTDGRPSAPSSRQVTNKQTNIHCQVILKCKASTKIQESTVGSMCFSKCSNIYKYYTRNSKILNFLLWDTFLFYSEMIYLLLCFSYLPFLITLQCNHLILL